MSAISVQQMADRVAALMEERLAARGTGLAAKLKSRGGALPRKVRHAAEELVQTATMAQNPKLLLQIDHEALARNYDICVKHLSYVKRHSGLLDGTIAIAASVAMSVLLVVILVVALMRWRGLI
jgi:hypothetical protein